MKITTVVFGVILFMMFCSDSGRSNEIKPEKVHRIVYEIMPDWWYKDQEGLWQKEVEKDPQNAEAWHNYYNASRYAHFDDVESTQRQKKLAAIIADMGRAIPDTYEYYLLKHWNDCGIDDLSMITKAYQLHPERPETYYPFISHAEVHGDKTQFNEFCEKLYESRDISPSLLNYNYNVLVSLDANAVLFTNGDNDTYPVWMLQTVKQIRPDVLVINVSMAPIKDYLERKLAEKHLDIDVQDIRKFAVMNDELSRPKFIEKLRGEIQKKYPGLPIYYASTVYSPFVEPIKNNLYVVGLAQRYSENRIDNVAVVKRLFEQEYQLDYLQHDWYREDMLGTRLMNTMNMNYVVPMIMLGEYYAENDQAQDAQRWFRFALDLARKNKAGEAAKNIEGKLENLEFNKTTKPVMP